MFCEYDFVCNNCNISFHICGSPFEDGKLGRSSISFDFLIPVEQFQLSDVPSARTNE